MIKCLSTLLILLAMLSGCVTQSINSANIPSLSTYEMEPPNDEVLDVAVVVFDPEVTDVDQAEGIYPEIRRAEATFMARELTSVLDDQGVWGATRLVPSSDHIADVLISGVIKQSDGETLSLRIKATDAQGRIWIEKQYTGTTSKHLYEQTQRVKKEPFLAVYREIANDLIAIFISLARSDRLAIRDVAKLKFAQSFAPEAFEGYLSEDEGALTRAVRLPAESDPMMARLGAIQQRNHIFVDTLQGHYDNFSEAMEGPYDEWRRKSYQETRDLRELKREYREGLAVGSLAMLASIAAASSDNRTTQVAGLYGARDAGELIKRSMERRAEANIHSLALEELGQSLEAEITPQVIELEDRTIQLSGTIEDQYGQWREILSDIYAAEIAELPTDISQPSP